jgi:hypothetical protein
MTVMSFAPSWTGQNVYLDAWTTYAPSGQVDTEVHASLPLFWNQGHEHVQRVRARLLGYVASPAKVVDEIVKKCLIADSDSHGESPHSRRASFSKRLIPRLAPVQTGGARASAREKELRPRTLSRGREN